MPATRFSPGTPQPQESGPRKQGDGRVGTIPPRMAPVAIAAIEAARAGGWSRILDLPEGVTTADGATKADVKACIGNLFLTHLSITNPRRRPGAPTASNCRIESRLRSKKPPVRHHSRAKSPTPLRRFAAHWPPNSATITITLRRDPESPARPRRPAPWATVTDTRRSQAVRSLWSGNAGPSFSP